MVNDLQELMRANVDDPPPDRLDLDGILGAGRRRVRTRRTAVAGATALLVAGVLALSALGLPGGDDHAQPADVRPTPDAPTLALADAEPAVTGRDYRELTSYTNQDLDRDNGQYLDGVTEDGLVLFQDGPRAGQLFPRFALMDPATGEKDWLPRLRIGQTQTRPVELGRDRLVLVANLGDGASTWLVAYVFDRGSGQWSAMKWPGLATAEDLPARMGPDGRLWVSVPATRSGPPPGGWPTGPDGEADDANADGDTYHLWSVSLTSMTDVRDEGLTVGDVAFTDSSMVWTDATDGHAGRVHVRDLASGEEHSFDPHAGARCNLLSLGATDERVVMSQYCGTYDDGGRDDRVQVLTTDGDQVVTLQGDGLDGALAGPGAGVVTLSSYERGRTGTYVYDLRTDRFLRISAGVSSWASPGGAGAAVEGQFLWDTPVNHRHGSTQHLGELVRPAG